MKQLLTAALLLCAAAAAQNGHDVSLLKALHFREIGPANPGGRTDDFAVVESNTNIVYVGTAGGGVFKTINGGVTWTPVFDDQAVSTIGDVTVSQSEPDVVWVGTGEANNRQSSSWGNGVYKSMDGGKSWRHMGLTDTHHIPRILIHPTNANIVYVAAQGHLWGPNEERGLFKTIDGGKTWTKVLYINADTGVTDMVMDPMNPDTIYAAAYQRRRTPYGMNGGGPGSAIYRTTDGGATWKKLTEGLPKGDIGRMGLDIYRRNGNIVYALVESEQSGIYRTDDKGEHWTKIGSNDPRPMYFSQVRIDPNNDQRIWVAGQVLEYSEDGGKTFTQYRVKSIHSDFHAIWIDPSNSNNMIAGCDGGTHFSHDAGRNWDAREQIAIGQFYEIAYDMGKPYKLCGGLQDNDVWCGPSATTNIRGITNADWSADTTEDGFYAQIDPEEPWIVYMEGQGGNLVRRDLRTHEARNIKPHEEDDKMTRFRFNWNAPLVQSKHDRKTVYFGGQYVFKSTNQGNDWKRISPDLTNNVSRNTYSIMGQKVSDRTMLSRNDGVSQWPTITTISESSARAGILWAGTDDGNVQVSRDGETWKNVTANISGVPKGTYVSRVLASAFDPGTAYAVFDGHRGDDYGTYLYKTTDFGATWTAINAGIPKVEGGLHVVREHPRNPNLLFAGGEFGLYISFDRGEHWQELKNNLPRVPVDDIQIHPRENDLILATHGRSVWIMDSISALEQMTPKTAERTLNVFDIRPATLWKMYVRRPWDSQDVFEGENPPYGAIIDFWTKSKPEARDVKIAILDGTGKQISTIKPSNLDAGINRVVWDMRYDRPIPVDPREVAAAEAFFLSAGLRPGQMSPKRGPIADPGEYTVEITVGGERSTKKFTVEEDPRITWFSAADRAKRREALNDLLEMSKQSYALLEKFLAADSSLKVLQASWKQPDAPKVPDKVKNMAEAIRKSLNEVRPAFSSGRGGGGGESQLSQLAPDERREFLSRPEPEFVLQSLASRVTTLSNQLQVFSAAPSETHLEQIALVKKAIAYTGSKITAIRQEVTKFNDAMNAARVPFIPVP